MGLWLKRFATAALPDKVMLGQARVVSLTTKSTKVEMSGSKTYHKDEPETTLREGDILVHHLDLDLLVRSLTGELKYYDYSEDMTFYKWAWEHRLVGSCDKPFQCFIRFSSCVSCIR